jgi:hypothetical protein
MGALYRDIRERQLLHAKPPLVSNRPSTVGGVVAEFGYSVEREGDRTILAVDTRSVNKGFGLAMAGLSGLVGLGFLLAALRSTQQDERWLEIAIVLASAVCVAVTLMEIGRIVVRKVVFTADTLVVDADGVIQFFELSLVEGLEASGHTLKVRYGSQALTLLKRVPDIGRVEARVGRLLEEHKQRAPGQQD